MFIQERKFTEPQEAINESSQIHLHRRFLITDSSKLCSDEQVLGEINNNRITLLSGLAGIGKTIELQHIQNQFLLGNQPIITLNLDELFKNSTLFERPSPYPNTIIFIDRIDPYITRTNYQFVLTQLKRLRNKGYIIILASRTEQSKLLLDNEIQHYKIEPLTKQQSIELFSKNLEKRKLTSEKTELLLNRIENLDPEGSLLELLKIPINIRLLSETIDETTDLNQLTEAKILEIYYQKKVLECDFEKLKSNPFFGHIIKTGEVSEQELIDLRENLLHKIAIKLLSRGNNSIDIKNLNLTIEEGSSSEILFERQLLENLVSEGLIDKNVDNQYSFVHQTIQEYILAKALISKINREKFEDNINAIIESDTDNPIIIKTLEHIAFILPAEKRIEYFSQLNKSVNGLLITAPIEIIMKLDNPTPLELKLFQVNFHSLAHKLLCFGNRQDCGISNDGVINDKIYSNLIRELGGIRKNSTLNLTPDKQEIIEQLEIFTNWSTNFCPYEEENEFFSKEIVLKHNSLPYPQLSSTAESLLMADMSSVLKGTEEDNLCALFKKVLKEETPKEIDNIPLEYLIKTIYKKSELGSQNSAKESENHFFASEDSALFLRAVNSNLRNLKDLEPYSSITQIDICTGSALIPATQFLNGNCDRIIALDKYPDNALTKKQELIATLPENHSEKFSTNFLIQKHDALEDAFPEELLEWALGTTHSILTANPPGEPVPPELNAYLKNPKIIEYITQLSKDTADNQLDDQEVESFINYCEQNKIPQSEIKKFPLICGGENGLDFINPILSQASRIQNLKSINLNISSISNIPELLKIIDHHGYKIEKVFALETIAYNYDNLKPVREYLKKLEAEQKIFTHQDLAQDTRYLILNLRLTRKNQQSANNQNLVDLEKILRDYKAQNSDWLLQEYPNFSLYALSEQRKL